jgi:hypothetical protein
MTNEPLREELRNILNIIADLSKNNPETDSRAKRPYEEMNDLLKELRLKGLIIEVFPKPAGIDFSLYRITTEGLNKL